MERLALLAELLAGMGLSVPPQTLPAQLRFIDELERWNRRINLTAITDPTEALEKHLVDSLTVLPLLEGDERLLDLGSGGGFPGIPLKLARPGLRVVSVDAAGKKISFQRHVARQLEMKEFTALAVRAEDLPRHPAAAGGFEVIVSRAFTSISTFAALAHPCLAPGGFLIAMKGAEGDVELKASLQELHGTGWACTEVRRLWLPLSAAQRTLIVLRQIKRNTGSGGALMDGHRM